MRKDNSSKDFIKPETITLNDIVKKERNARAFENFLNTRIDSSPHSIQHFENPVNKSASRTTGSLIKLKTVKNADGSITTKELCTIPFIYLQSETVLYPNGTKIITLYYPSSEQIPAKSIEYSHQSTITKTTTYDTKGHIKTIERVVNNTDGSGFEEKIEFKHNRKTKRKFNKYKITTEVESYVKDKLVFTLECDKYGNLLKERTFYSYSQEPILQKEVTYYEQYYTIKEYDPLGEFSFTKTVITSKDNHSKEQNSLVNMLKYKFLPSS